MTKQSAVVWILYVYCLSGAVDCQECQGEAPQTKTGVAMLVKTNHVKYVSSSETEDAHGIKREAALIHQVLASRTGKLSQPMVESLVSMNVTPEVSDFIQATLQSMEPVFGDIEESSANDTAYRNGLLQSFDGQRTNFTLKLKDVVVHETNAATHRRLHIECRESENGLLDEKIVCDGEEATLLTRKNEALQALKGTETSLKAWLCQTNVNVTKQLLHRIDTTVHFVAAGEKYLEAEHNHSVKAAECVEKNRKYLEKREECNTEQRYLEDDVCLHGQALYDKCMAYDAGYNTSLTYYEQAVKDIENRQKGRIFEWKHLKRINCTLKALATHTVQNHQTLTAIIHDCQSNPFDNPVLVIEKIPAPARAECPQLPPVPCKDDYITKEYALVPDGGKLPQGTPAADCERDCLFR